MATKKNVKKLNACPVRTTLELIGGKWAFAILYSLMDGTKDSKNWKDPYQVSIHACW